MARITIALAMMVALLLPAVSATTYLIRPDGSGDFPTIEAAVQAAADGDVILLAELTDGTFRGDGNRDIDLLGKALAILSASGNPEMCAMDCEGNPGSQHGAFLLV